MMILEINTSSDLDDSLFLFRSGDPSSFIETRHHACVMFISALIIIVAVSQSE